MLNNVVLVGRVVVEPELNVYESGVRSTKVLLSVAKPFRNSNNEYEYDLIPIYVWYKMADVVCDYVGVGSIVGFKCRLGTHKRQIGDLQLTIIDVIAERLSFIDLKPRTGKSQREVEDMAIDRELQNVTYDDLDNIDLKSKELVVDEEDFATYSSDDEEKSNDKTKKKAKK